MNSRLKLIFSSTVFIVLVINEYLFDSYLPVSVVLPLTLLAYLFCGLDVVFDAVKMLIKQKRMTEQLLMTIATFAAFILKDFPEALAIMVFYKIGAKFEDFAKARSHSNIMHLASIRPQIARVVIDGEDKEIKPRDVKIGDTIKVLKGEIVPVDGVLQSDCCALDTRSLTGESKTLVVNKSDNVLSGSVNMSDVIYIKVTKLYKNSSLTKLINLIEDSAINKSKSEDLIRRFCTYYTPFVVITAIVLCLVPVFLEGAVFSDWIERALVFLVVSCPCALVLSVPLTFFAGIGALSKIGVLVKGSVHIETISRLKAIAFDKTGTLSTGEFKLSDVITSLDKNYLFSIIFALEKNSTHPISKSLLQEAKSYPIEQLDVCDFKEISGFGLTAFIDKKEIHFGSYEFVKKICNCADTHTDDGYTRLYLVIDKELSATLLLEDCIKDDAKALVSYLDSNNIKSTIISGDLKGCVQLASKKTGIKDYYYQTTPDKKVEVFKKIKEQNQIVAFCGDGLNDAPVINLSDVSFVMGKKGSALSVESADIIVMNDSLESVRKCFVISKRIYKTAVFNIAFVIFIKFMVLFLGAFGFANIYSAIFADVGVLILAVLNAMRALTFR